MCGDRVCVCVSQCGVGVGVGVGVFGWLWLGVGLGYRVMISQQISLEPAVSLLLNFGSGSESFINTILLPRLIGRFKFSEGPSLYLGAEINMNIPNSGSDRMEFDAAGPGFGALIGYAFDGNWSVEGGYLIIPVDVASSTGPFADQNMGGPFVRLAGVF